MENTETENENKLLSKLNGLEQKVLDFLNIKLKVKITGKEINLELSNKNIGNNELMLLTCIEFDNLQNINLSIIFPHLIPKSIKLVIIIIYQI